MGVVGTGMLRSGGQGRAERVDTAPSSILHLSYPGCLPDSCRQSPERTGPSLTLGVSGERENTGLSAQDTLANL